MKLRPCLLVLLCFCGCAHDHYTTSRLDDRSESLQEERLLRSLTNRLEQTSELVAALRQVAKACAITSQNMANAQTVGYKKVVPGFEYGGRLVIRRSFAQGDLSQTGEELDVAIVGVGFFQVQLPDGTIAYTRDGAFRIASDGRIVTHRGYPVNGWQPRSPATTSVNITTRGQVTYSSAGGSTSFNIFLARFQAPAELSVDTEGYFRATGASGVGELGNPGDDGFGELQQGFLELSNVHTVEEMARMISLHSWKRELMRTLEARATGK